MLVRLLALAAAIAAVAVDEEPLWATARGGMCVSPPNWVGLHLMTYHATNSEFARMILELYYNKSLLTRSFFHNCTGPFLLRHHIDPIIAPTILYGKRHFGDVVASRCPAPTDDCLCSEGRRYAAHIADYLIERVDSGKRAVVIDIDRMSAADYGATVIGAVEKALGPTPWLYDADRYARILRFLATTKSSAVTVFHKASAVARAPVAVSPRSAECAAALWRRAGPLPLRTHFGEFGDAFFDDLAKPLDKRRSTLPPNVNVLIPCKNPSNIERCVRSLVELADLRFGSVHLHFGLDWKDNKTRATVDKVCVRHAVTCEYHEVFSRGSDISAIVNHMFVTIEESGYFFRFNDDSEMLTRDWNIKAVGALRTEPVDVGVALIMDLTNTGLQTHSFVSSMHKQIFGYYFPHHFKNSYEDNWITSVYAGDSWSKASFVRIRHHAKGVRYTNLNVPRDVVDMSVDRGRARIARYVAQHRADLYSDSFE